MERRKTATPTTAGCTRSELKPTLRHVLCLLSPPPQGYRMMALWDSVLRIFILNNIGLESLGSTDCNASSLAKHCLCLPSTISKDRFAGNPALKRHEVTCCSMSKQVPYHCACFLDWNSSTSGSRRREPRPYDTPAQCTFIVRIQKLFSVMLQR